MARSGKGGKSRGKDPEDDRGSALTSALNHRIRRGILRLLHTSEESCSPARIAEALNLPLAKVNYHVKVLVRLQTVKMVCERQVRGTIEHFYTSTIDDKAAIRLLLKTTRASEEA